SLLRLFLVRPDFLRHRSTKCNYPYPTRYIGQQTVAYFLKSAKQIYHRCADYPKNVPAKASSMTWCNCSRSFERTRPRWIVAMDRRCRSTDALTHLLASEATANDFGDDEASLLSAL